MELIIVKRCWYIEMLNWRLLQIIRVTEHYPHDWLIDLLVGWLIDWLLFYVQLKNFSLMWRRFHCRWRTSLRRLLGTQGLWAWRNLYRATPAVIRCFGFSGIIRRTAKLTRFLRLARGCRVPILTRILTSLHYWHSRWIVKYARALKRLLISKSNATERLISKSFGIVVVAWILFWVTWESIWERQNPGNLSAIFCYSNIRADNGFLHFNSSPYPSYGDSRWSVIHIRVRKLLGL
jgi:hypothetical protein